MINVIVGNNVKRNQVIIPPSSTLRAALEEGEIDYSNGVMHLDGSSIAPGDLNKTFAEFGYDGSEGHDKCFLLNVVKADNAA